MLLGAARDVVGWRRTASPSGSTTSRGRGSARLGRGGGSQAPGASRGAGEVGVEALGTAGGSGAAVASAWPSAVASPRDVAVAEDAGASVADGGAAPGLEQGRVEHGEELDVGLLGEVAVEARCRRHGGRLRCGEPRWSRGGWRRHGE